MNVIVIMEDSFRKDHLGCYGNKWIKTPNIDKFASNATIFDHAYAEGMPTIPVRSSLFTGRYTLPFRGWQPLWRNDVLLAEVLWDQGITSALITDTYHMHKPQMGFGRGFDYVRWIRGQECDPAILGPNVKIDLTKFSEKNWKPGGLLGRARNPERISKEYFEQYLRNSAHWKSEEDHHVAKVVKAGMNWLEEMITNGKRDNLFLWLDSFDPHEPWDPPSNYTEMYPVPEYDGLPIIGYAGGGGFVEDWTLTEIRHIRSQYAGSITMVDTWTGIFLEKVEELGLLDNTMIIFLSDHGEPLGEHGIIKKIRPWPYDELSRIPLLILLPDGMGSKKHINSFVGMADIAPTVLSFLHVKVPPVMQGKNLLPLIQGKNESMKYGISGFFRRSWSIRNHEYSFYQWLETQSASKSKTKSELYRYDPDFIPPQPSKYDLEIQAEKENLIEDEPEMSDHLKNEMKIFLEELSPSPGDLMTKDLMERRTTTRS